jgi:hypothetical protein
MPTPSSIWSSGRSKPGCPEAGVVHAVRATPNDLAGHVGDRLELLALLGQGAGDLLDEDGGAGAATASRVEAVLHGDVVVDDDRGDLDVLVGRQLGGHLEVEDVAGVVLHDVQHAGAAVDGLGGEQHLVRHRRGEHLAGAGSVQHAEADEAAVQGLVAGAAAGDQPDLAGSRPAGPGDDLVLDVDGQ